MMTSDAILVLLLCIVTPPAAAAASSRPQKILLSDVQILTLRGNGAATAHRRVPSIPQLRCISSDDAICQLHSIDIMRCTNQGSSYGAEDIEWSCVAELPAELRLSSADVICEGFQDAEDPYVLRGSCGVEYVLALTELGEEKYPEIAHPPPPPLPPPPPASTTPSQPWFDNGHGGEDYSAWLFSVIFVAVCGLVVYSACFAKTDRSSSTEDPPRSRERMVQSSDPHDRYDDDVLHDVQDIRRGIRRGVGGWGAAASGRGPPPPYSERRDHPLLKRDYDTRRDHDDINYAYTRQRGWTPGFWSGLAGGSAAGYVVGRNAGSSSATTNGARTRTRMNDEYHRTSWDDGPALPRPSSSVRSPSAHQPFNSGSGSGSTSKSDRYESTGYGSTRRR